MLGAGGGTSSYKEIETTDLIVLWGSNARNAHPIFFHHLTKGIRNGAKMYTVDPRRSESAEWADTGLGIDGGSDIALSNTIAREIIHRRLNFGLSLLAIVTAVALFVAFFTTGQGATRETRRLMRDMGFNLRIIPGQTDMEDFWASGCSAATMPEEYVRRLATQEGLSYAHLGAMLQRRVRWQGREIMLTGILPELALLRWMWTRPIASF